MSVYTEPIHRCSSCGEVRNSFGVNWNRNVSKKADRCPYCEVFRPGTEKSLKIIVRKGLPEPNRLPNREPDRMLNGVELYATTRGEITAKVEKEEWDGA